MSFSKSSSLVIIFDNLTVIFLCPHPFHLLGHILGHLSSHNRCQYPFSCLFVSPVSFPFLIFVIFFPETQRLAGRSMGTRGRLLLVPTHCLGFLGCQWWPDPRDLLRSWALTKTHSLLVLICRVGGRTCEIYPVALCTSRNCGSGGSLGGPSHAVVLHQHF